MPSHTLRSLRVLIVDDDPVIRTTFAEQLDAQRAITVVAAASVIAKVARDRLMSEADDPGYGWASNKGYGSAAHARAIGRLGVSDFHRRSWKMPTSATK